MNDRDGDRGTEVERQGRDGAGLRRRRAGLVERWRVSAARRALLGGWVGRRPPPPLGRVETPPETELGNSTAAGTYRERLALGFLQFRPSVPVSK